MKDSTSNILQPKPPVIYLDDQGWEFIEDTIVEFKGVLLPDNREVDISVEFSGDWDDGAFDWEQGSQRGTHRYPLSFEIGDVQVTYALNTHTHQEIPIDPVIAAAGSALFDVYEESIRDKMEPPSNEPDPDDQRD
jgi:hypothetical protein